MSEFTICLALTLELLGQQLSPLIISELRHARGAVLTAACGYIFRRTDLQKAAAFARHPMSVIWGAGEWRWETCTAGLQHLKHRLVSRIVASGYTTWQVRFKLHTGSR